MSFNRSDLPANLQDPAMSYIAITPSDTEALTRIPRALYVGTGGDLKLCGVDGVAVVLRNVPSGFYHIGVALKIYETGTSAGDIVGFI